MKIAYKGAKPKPEQWEAGNYTVMIDDIKLARTKYGAVIMSKIGNCPKIEVVVTCIKTKRKMSYLFFDTPKTKWISKMICKAAGVPFSESLDVDLLRNQFCVASVRTCFYTEDGENTLKDNTGAEITTSEIFEFLNPGDAPEELCEDKKKFYRAATELKWHQ